MYCIILKYLYIFVMHNSMLRQVLYSCLKAIGFFRNNIKQ
jgi:hypothetical protein